MSASLVNGTLSGGFQIVLSSMIVNIDTNGPEFPIPKGAPYRRPTSNILVQ
jgi:hypothetical protein